MKWKYFTYPLLALVLSAAGCGSNNDSYDSEYQTEAAGAGYTAKSETPDGATAFTDRKLIRNARLDFETDNVAASREEILSAIRSNKGTVANDRTFDNPGRTSVNITARIPAAQFDSFIAVIDEHVAKYDSKEITSDDITAEFVDIEARLTTKKNLEARYRELLSSTKTIADVLEIERQMATLRGEIESIEGRLNLLKNQVDYSTIHITCYTSIESETAFGRKFAEGIGNGWENMMWFFVGLINVWPFILVTIALLIFLRRLNRKRNKKLRADS